MGMVGDFLERASTPFLIALGLLYAGGAFAAQLKPSAGDKVRWNKKSAARVVERALVWMGLKVYHGVSRMLRGALDALEEASADVGEWFGGNRGAQA